ncbi:MAG: hypothetical protein ACRC2O_04100, partial [Chitinophagaceae bacterium]
MKLLLILLIGYCYFYPVSNAQTIQPIGYWREHLPYNNALHVAVDKLVYCATPYGFFIYDKVDASFERMSKINGLSEVRVRLMKKDPQGERIVLVYENANIDFLDGGKVVNLPDILLSNISGDRTAYGIYWQSNLVYLCTGLGIIVIDADKNEVKDTYRPSSNGGDIRVNDLVELNGFLYAATVEGIKFAKAASPGLADYKTWQTISGNGLSPGAIQRIAVFNNALIVQKNDSVLKRQGNDWSVLFHNGMPISGLDVNASQLMIAQSDSGKGQVQILNIDGNITQVLTSAVLSLPRQTSADGSYFWVADQNNGLLRVDGMETE